MLERLGPDLKSLIRGRSKPFTLDSVVHIGVQLLERLAALHSQGYVHRDIKPDNVLLGGELDSPASKDVYLIDFGICRQFRNKNGEHTPLKTNQPFAGNVIFSSRNALLNYSCSRRDDLEALIYLLIFLYKGSLPWITEKLVNLKEYAQCKAKATRYTLCESMPSEFGDLLDYVRNMKYDEEPDYRYMKQLLKRSILDLGSADKIEPIKRFKKSVSHCNKFSETSEETKESPQHFKKKRNPSLRKRRNELTKKLSVETAIKVRKISCLDSASSSMPSDLKFITPPSSSSAVGEPFKRAIYEKG